MKHVNRRNFLRGAGSVLIGIPLVEELQSADAQGEMTPTRVLTLSFGLGLAKDLQEERFDGPLKPFENVASKMAFFSNLENNSIKGGGVVHFDVGATQFTGVKQDGVKQATGPSLEQLFKNKLHPGGVPSVTGLPSKSAGIWSRTGAVPQYCRHWNDNGSPGELPERRPSKVFDDLFGSFMPTPMTPDGMPDPEFEIEKRIQRSVLDTVKEQHQSLTGPNSFLGMESKARLDNHLQAIREVEMQLVDGDAVVPDMESPECMVPTKGDYADPAGVSFYDAQSGAVGGPKVDWEATQKAFRLSGDLFVLGLACDALRFGSMVYVEAGGHIRFQGNYSALGDSLNFTNVFNGSSPHDAIFHNYVRSNVRVYQHYVISQLGYVLDKMDAVTEANGKTLLDNTLTVIGTEYGRNHDNTDIFHAVAGGNGKFKPGQYDGRHSFGDLYSTLTRAYDIDSNIAGNEIPGLVV